MGCWILGLSHDSLYAQIVLCPTRYSKTQIVSCVLPFWARWSRQDTEPQVNDKTALEHVISWSLLSHLEMSFPKMIMIWMEALAEHMPKMNDGDERREQPIYQKVQQVQQSGY